MTMNKAEKARMAELEAALAGATIKTRAFEEPRPMTRDEIETAKVEVTPRDRSVYRTRNVALGWGFNDYIGSGVGGRVYPMWSDGIHHGDNNHTGDGGSQQMGRMYRTEREAMIALRLSLQKQFGKHLADWDRRIAESGK